MRAVHGRHGGGTVRTARNERPVVREEHLGSAAYAMGPQDDPTVVVVMGGGENGLVLAPMSNGNYCQWRAQAKHFVDDGYRVASLSWAEDRAASVELAAQCSFS